MRSARKWGIREFILKAVGAASESKLEATDARQAISDAHANELAARAAATEEALEELLESSSKFSKVLAHF